MKNLIGKGATVLMVLSLAAAPAVVSVHAEEEAAPSAGTVRSHDVDQRIDELKKLKQENPAEFERLMDEHKAKLKERLHELKEKDPEKYEEVKNKIKHHRHERLKRLREENPKKFHEIMEQKAHRLGELKEQDPARYEQFMKNHPHLADRMAQKHDHREDWHDRGLHRGEELGVRDHGQGVGQGKGRGFHGARDSN